MKTVSLIDKLKIYRPLLGMKKSTILKWLKEKNISYFIDSTNVDKSLLRGRMRETLIPTLSSIFGKEIQEPLIKIAEDAHLLDDFMRA